MDIEDPERVAEWQKFAECHSPDKISENHEEVYHCGGGVNGFAIDPEGKMSICVLSHVDTFDLRRGSFRQGWDHFLYQVRQRKATRITKCTHCGIRSMCGMCPANGELENGDPEKPVDFLCHVAHLRAKAMDIPVPPHGDCEYCEGGSKHSALLDSLQAFEARRSEEWAGVGNGNGHDPFRILSDRPSESGGCSSCHL
jgi:radical SAM protein with 4Fe4S-binding SPASM domain